MTIVAIAHQEEEDVQIPRHDPLELARKKAPFHANYNLRRCVCVLSECLELAEDGGKSGPIDNLIMQAFLSIECTDILPKQPKRKRKLQK